MKISRYFSVLILTVVFSLLFTVAGHAENNVLDEFCVQADYKFTSAELKSLELIKKAKGFEKKLGYKETKNFKSFSKDIRHTSVNYQLKTELPFSYKDYRFFRVYKKQSKNEASEIKWLACHLKTTKENYDIDVYYPEVVAGGTAVSPAMLRAKPSRLAYLVFHEDWHDNVDLPIHFEEAAGNLIGFVAAWKFLDYDEETIHKKLEEYSKFAEAINRCHDEISKLVTQLKNKKISREEYLVKRQQHLIVAEKSQNYWCSSLEPIDISRGHTYTYYCPLAHRLYRALDGDLVRFIQVLKEVNEREDMREPSWSKIIKETDMPEGMSGSTLLKLAEIDYFVETRKAERKIEAYLENVIKKALSDKNRATVN